MSFFHAFSKPAQAQGAPGLVRQIGEHALVVFLRVAQLLPGLGGEPEQGLRQRQGHHLSVGETQESHANDR